MGRKDASHTGSLPVEQYRKQIGKENYKRSKKEMKEVTRQSQAKKSAMGIKDVLLMLVCFLATVGGIYALLYFTLQPKKSESTGADV